MQTVEGILAVTRELADEVLFPDAMRVDRLDVLPAAYLDAFATAGLYGAPVPADAGGLGLDLPEVGRVVEELEGGCLTAAFVLIQHFRLVMTLADEAVPPALRDRWLASACRGRTRGGIALTGLIPGPPQLCAEPAGGGWRLDGTAPLGPGPLDGEVTPCRERLDAALGTGPGPMADARAAAAELALRATAALAVRGGASSVTVDQHAQRLAREAVFLLVFGSRPGIKSALLQRLGAVAGSTP